MKEIGKEIKKIRSLNNLSQKRFGYKVGLSGKTISAYENGKIVPPFKILERISEVYDINLIKPIGKHKSQALRRLENIERSIQDLKDILNI